MRILVTGAAGSIGSLLVPALEQRGYRVCATDIDTLDVTKRFQVEERFMNCVPDVVFHLAGAKHAPEGELDPEHVSQVNLTGTANIVKAANHVGSKVVFASTCKACDPETAYGASKLIAERLVLNAAGVVVRYYNVRETAGNVFRIWEETPESEPILFTDCWRYFITAQEALNLTLAGIDLPPGRYTVDPGTAVRMYGEARRLYPDRNLVRIPPRRGDRLREPLKARCEHMEGYGEFFRVSSAHDPEYALHAVA